MRLIKTHQDLLIAVDGLCAIEAQFKAVVSKHGIPDLRTESATLETLLKIVVEQFLSVKAAHAIWGRVKDHLGEISKDSVLRADFQFLTTCGLSRSKVKTFQACAQSEINFDTQDIIVMRKALLAIWGIGPWTAEIFLLSACGHSDAWPVGDVALQAAAQDLFGLECRPSPKVLETLSLPWRPYRKAAALLLWAHYRGLKQLPQAPSQNL